MTDSDSAVDRVVRSGIGGQPSLPLRWVAVVAAVAAGAVLGATGVWATLTVFAPPAVVVDEATFTLVEVVPGEVGSSIGLNTVAAWAPVPVGSNLAVGTVTSVLLSPGQEVGTGTSLYTVNLRPVVIAQGSVPAFRSLSRGAHGTDVAQLQSMLTALGFYSYEVDGVFDRVTEQAVQVWQESMGLADDGAVQAGDVIFVPALPTRVSLDAKVIERGAMLSGGEPVVLGLPSAPVFTVPVSEAQSALMPDGTRVEVAGPQGEVWVGFVADRRTQQQSQTVDLILTGQDGAAICGAECESIPVVDQSLLLSRVITVETVAGLVVPSAALLSKADGSIAVIDEGGLEHPVTVLAGAKGMSVIEGVDAGVSVRLPATGQQ